MISTTEKPVLAIGDCHGHLNRLEALLEQEGIIGPCPDCEATGDGALEGGFCERCDGLGIARLNHDVFVLQLGDLGHFGSQRGSMGNTVPGSATADLMCWKYGRDWLDANLFGNHDYAVFNSIHEFGGYIPPPYETKHLMTEMWEEGRVPLVFSAHGFLFTHAGLHIWFKHNKIDEIPKKDPVAFAEWMNGQEANTSLRTKNFYAIRDAIGKVRGGRSNMGGILWRDAREKLYREFRQIFGHTAGDKVRKYDGPNWSYCIDVGDQHNGRLAGIWIPDERIVEVDVKVVDIDKTV